MIEITDDDNENFGAKFIECVKGTCGITTPMVFQCMEGAEEKLTAIWSTRPEKCCGAVGAEACMKEDRTGEECRLLTKATKQL